MEGFKQTTKFFRGPYIYIVPSIGETHYIVKQNICVQNIKTSYSYGRDDNINWASYSSS